MNMIIVCAVSFQTTGTFVILYLGSDEEQGLTVKHCDASNDKSMNYRFLTSG